MFHVELRQFPHVARAFNLTREELDARFARPWVSGTAIEHDERRWSPDRARLTIFEGPELRPDEIGMGRGWAAVGKTSQEVTETVLAEAARGSEGRTTVESFKAELRVAARTPLTLADVMRLAVRDYPQWRASEQLALAEQAVWELLHQGGLALSGPDGRIERDGWREPLLSWATWTSDALVLQTPGAAGPVEGYGPG